MAWLRPGSVVDGRYLIGEVLGEGGMGVVFRARHQITGAEVAIKTLHAHIRVRRDLVTRFLNEARAPAAIGHPGIVSVMDAGITPDGDPYFVMELLDGEPLNAMIRRGSMPFETIRRVGLGILDALAAAHAAGFVHRDLKPENVFLQSGGTLKLLDFGIAKSLGDSDSDVTTKTGATMGTLFFMSPEQLRNAKRVDFRTDLWAVGVMLHLMLTGDVPYRAESLGDMLMLVLSQPPRPLAAYLAVVPPELDQFEARALARDPAQRFQSAAEMSAALAGLPAYNLVRHAEPLPIAPVIAATEVPAAKKSSRALWVGIIVGVIGLILLGGGAVLAVSGFYFAANQQFSERKPGCERACKALIACKVPGQMEECVTECQTDETLAGCMAAGGESCDTIASCHFQRLCATEPGGTATCRETHECRSKCSSDVIGCLCGCIDKTDPKKAAKELSEFRCAFYYCEDQCQNPSSKECADCAQNRCRQETETCNAN